MTTDSRRCQELNQNENEALEFLKRARRAEHDNKREVSRIEMVLSESQRKLIGLEQSLSIILVGAADLLKALRTAKRRLPYLKPENAPEAIAQIKLIADESANLEEAKKLLAYRKEQLAQNQRDVPYFQAALKRTSALRRENGC